MFVVCLCLHACAQPGSKPFTYSKIFDVQHSEGNKAELWLGSLPKSFADLQTLHTTVGIQAVVTLNQEWEVLVRTEDVRRAGMAHLVMPTPDYSAVSLVDLRRGVDYLHHEMHTKGNSVFVHCNAGKGRSTMVILCYLIRHHGMTPLEAYEHCRRRRKIARFLMCGGRKPQFRQVKVYARKYGGSTTVSKSAADIHGSEEKAVIRNSGGGAPKQERRT